MENCYLHWMFSSVIFFCQKKSSLLVWSNIGLNSSKNLYCDAIGWMMPFSFLYCFVTLRSNIRGSIKTQRSTVDYFCHQFCKPLLTDRHSNRPKTDLKKIQNRPQTFYIFTNTQFNQPFTIIYNLGKRYRSV